MSHHDHDDGIEHGHSWASSERGRPAHGRPRPIVIPAPRGDHDDGIEHGHAWACGDRGRPSHAR
jgi:hypothetical protein